MSSHPSSLLRVPVEMPNRSGHNLSHSNSFTGKTGQLIPVLCEELLPNDTVSLGCQLQVQLPPMVTDFYGRVDFVLEAFFVPNRLCWGGWQDFITHPTANPQYPVSTPITSKPSSVPCFDITASDNIYDIPVSSLLHYLDYGDAISYQNSENVSVLSAIAYHRIYDDWYRDSRVQSPLFFRPRLGTTSVLGGLPYTSVADAQGNTVKISLLSVFPDQLTITSLRQRNWVKDYFTTASPLPQAGGASEVKFDVSSTAESGAFSIATLRAANSLNSVALS